MSYFAVAVARGPAGWSADELDLGRPSDVEDVAELLRDHDTDADISLLFVEADDEYLVVLRLDEGEDLRVFGSDAAFAEESKLGTALLGDLEPPAPLLLDEAYDSDDSEESDESPAESAEAESAVIVAERTALDEAEPLGDSDLLADLGVPARKLIELCAREGMLPSDVTAEICAVLGCGDEVEELR